jgi:hypothetical protein
MMRRFARLASRFCSNQPGSAARPASRGRFRPVMEALEVREVPSSVPLHVAGTLLKDPSNSTVVLRGVNVASLEWRPDGPNVLRATDTALAWGANLIRLPVNQDFWFGHDQQWTGDEAGDGGAGYRGLVDQVVNEAQANNAYVMLDMHWSDMGVWGQHNGQHDMPDDHTTAFWQDAARRYANNPAVLFDPYNEPTVGGGWQPTAVNFQTWRDGGWISTDEFSGQQVAPYHSPGMQGLVDTIRTTGAVNVIAAEGLNWGSNLNGVVLGFGLNDPAGNLMYQSHLYPNKKEAPDVMTSLEQVGRQYPIYIGEWAEGSADANRAMIDWMGQRGYSWTAWALTPDFETEFNLITDWGTMTPTAAFGSPVKTALAVDHTNTPPVTPTPAPDPDPVPNPADLNTQVLGYALAQLGQQVGDGQCAALADAALKSAGALSFSDLGPTGDDADYVWGNLVATLTTDGHDASTVAPGDMIQFRDVTFVTTTINPDGSWSQSTMLFPHHTAVVESVDNNVITILQQNVDGDMTVRESTINLDDMTQGTMWVYQPTASQPVAPGGDPGIAPVGAASHIQTTVAAPTPAPDQGQNAPATSTQVHDRALAQLGQSADNDSGATGCHSGRHHGRSLSGVSRYFGHRAGSRHHAGR